MDIKKENPTIDTVIIVVDKVKRDFEVFYLTNLIKEISKTVKCSYHSGNMWQDFAMLYYAKNLVCSNSTFSWWAGLLGESTMNWFPDTMNYYDNQQFDKINDQTKVYKIDYWRN
jgi:predicted glycosyltransferase